MRADLIMSYLTWRRLNYNNGRFANCCTAYHLIASICGSTGVAEKFGHALQIAHCDMKQGIKYFDLVKVLN